VTPTTNGATIAYNYTAQVNKSTNVVGYWVDKDHPVTVGPDAKAYISDGHHTTAGYMAPNDPVRVILPGMNRVVLGHVMTNFYNPAAGTAAVDDTWWLARASENNAYLFGPAGNHLMLPADPGYAGLRAILPSILPMPTTPSTLGDGAMTLDHYRSLAWGLADGIVYSADNGAGSKVAGFNKKAANGKDIFFVEFFWADYLRNRIVWDDSKTGSALGSGNGDANAIKAPLSFFAAVANGIALAKSETYRDQFGRGIYDYTNAALFDSTTVYWATSSISTGLAFATNSYNLYLLDDSTINGNITPSALSSNCLHIDTTAGMNVTNDISNVRTLLVNSGSRMATKWKDSVVSNSTLIFPAGSAAVTLSGNAAISGATIVSNGSLIVNGTLSSASLTVAGGALSGNGVINGAVSVLANGLLAPGNSIGTLAINGSLTLGGATVMRINKTGATLSGDKVQGLTSLTIGGSLTVTATGDVLSAGDEFQFFTAASIQGSFSGYTLPALSGNLAWDTSRLAVDGTIRVVARPQLHAPVFTATNVVLSGESGPVGATFYVLSSTNVTVPLQNWIPVVTNVFDANGRFSVTNAVNAEPQRFFILQAP
jgi:hypothetical protein